MKLWKCIGLGLLLWSLTLIWPDVNLILTEQVMLKLLLGTALVTLIYLVEKHFIHHDDSRNRPSDQPRSNGNHNSRPMSPTPAHS